MFQNIEKLKTDYEKVYSKIKIDFDGIHQQLKCAVQN